MRNWTKRQTPGKSKEDGHTDRQSPKNLAGSPTRTLKYFLLSQYTIQNDSYGTEKIQYSGLKFEICHTKRIRSSDNGSHPFVGLTST